jgi:hypothetical protein
LLEWIDRMRFLIVISTVLICTAGCATVERVPHFRAGDIAVARHFTHHPELNGTQVLVTGEFQWRWIKGGSALRCYSIKTVDGQELAAQDFQLQSLAQLQR